MSSEMAERVARAICHEHFTTAGEQMMKENKKLSPLELAGATMRAVDENWKSYIGSAVAAIKSMRDPTEKMEDAPWRANVQAYEPSDLTQTLDSVSFKRVYQAMIDEAIK